MKIESFKLTKEFPGFDHKIGDTFIKTVDPIYKTSYWMKFDVLDGGIILNSKIFIKITEGEFFEKINVNIA